MDDDPEAWGIGNTHDALRDPDFQIVSIRGKSKKRQLGERENYSPFHRMGGSKAFREYWKGGKGCWRPLVFQIPE